MRSSRHRPRGKILSLSALFLLFTLFSTAQTTFPVNGVADPREGCYAFIHATVVKDGQTTLSDATLIIRDRLIVTAGAAARVAKDAVVIDSAGKYIYHSCIDIYSDYGIPVTEDLTGRPRFDFRAPPHVMSNT